MEQSIRLGIYITGQPGSGGSSLAKNIERTIGPETIERVSGGFLRRAEAYHWQKCWETYFPEEPFPDSVTSLPEYSEQLQRIREVWTQFEATFSNTYQEKGYEGIFETLTPYFDLPPNNSVLGLFNELQARFSPEVPIWDIVTDSFLLEKTKTAPSNFVLESKLAVVLDRIKEIQSSSQESSLPAAGTGSRGTPPIINTKIYLQVDPEISAQRISQREDTPVTAEEVLTRRVDDWRRYSTFYTDSESGQPLSETLAMSVCYTIDSSALNPEQILTEVYLFMLCQLNETYYRQPELAGGWIELLTDLLQQDQLLPVA